MLVVYLVIINILIFIIMGIDKYCALKNKTRVSEKVFFIGSLAGGFLGQGLAMIAFNHKIRKYKFYLMMAISACLWLGIIIYMG